MFHVRCPICGGVLRVDQRTRKVVSHLSKEEAERSPDDRFQSIMSSLQKSKAERDSKLAEAKKREAERRQHVEELFKKAQKRAEESEGDERPFGPVWD